MVRAVRRDEERRHLGTARRRAVGRGRFAFSTPRLLDSSAFTLVEVLIAVALTALVMGLLMYPLMSGIGYFRSATARGDAQTVARNALDVMARELSEAVYVQQDMNDNSMIAFAPPLRVGPNDPNSQIVTPPRPDWDHMVRYWRALHDPTQNYVGASHLGEPNPFFLARTVVEYPFVETDPWNQWNDEWVAWQENPVNPDSRATAYWAPIYRVVNNDVARVPGPRDADGNLMVGARDRTKQPGYPYLAAKWTYPNDDASQARFYRDHVKGMTPDATDYDVTALSFEPMVVSGEWLSPALGQSASDKSIYLARYPLWRLGMPFRSWTALQGMADPYLTPIVQAQTEWAPHATPRDPFLLIYRWTTGLGTPQYALIGVGVFDTRTRSMKVLRPTLDEVTHTTVLLYDTADYNAPYARNLALGGVLAFGVDWNAAALRFDFPPVNELARKTEDKPQQVTQIDVDNLAVPKAFTFPIASFWKDRKVGAAALDHFLLPDTVWVKLSTRASDGSDQPGRALRRVARPPRDFSDEYQLGLNPISDGVAEPVYGFVRLPEHYANGDPATSTPLWVYYRWRDNGTVEAGRPLEEEHPYLVCAYYRTGAVLDVGLTVTRADPSAQGEGRIRQSAHLTRRVKLHAVIRQIRHLR